jgi:serine/threonine-protein kinase
VLRPVAVTAFVRPRAGAAPTLESAYGAAHRGEAEPLAGRLPDDLAGVVLGDRYRLEREIGAGGMGRVYAGQHLTLGVPIAVKLMHPSLAAVRESVLRFAREAHAASRLQHRSVVRVLDYGEALGVPFIVMEFLEGETLASLIARTKGHLPIAEVGELLSQVLGALEAAHALGIVHRDLKPENIFLTREPGGERVVKVVDFGLAHVDDAPAGQTLTRADAIAGTPLYMSPEQCRSLAVGPSTDLYAVGCVLTELLQGRPPFSAETSMDLITKQLFMPAPPLDRVAGAEPVPELLERLRLELLAKTPERRPASARVTRERLAVAISPERAARVLPGRQGESGFKDRLERSPRWSDPAPPLSSPTPEAAGHLFDARLVRLSERARAVDEAMRVGLRSVGIALVDTPEEIVVLDAGDDLDGAERWLRASAAATVVVCLERSGAEALGRLIAAGAAEVVAYPVSIEVLEKRLARAHKRRR